MFLAKHRVYCDTLQNLAAVLCSIRLQQQFHLKALTNIKALTGNMHLTTVYTKESNVHIIGQSYLSRFKLIIT